MPRAFWRLSIAVWMLGGWALPGWGGSVTYSTANLSGDVWQYTYSLSGFTFSAGDLLAIYFDASIPPNLDPPPAVGSDWSLFTFQPDAALPAPGEFDAMALVNSPSFAVPFTISFMFPGGLPPGPQDFIVFDSSFEAIDSGVTTTAATTATPEPGSLAVALSGLAILALLRRKGVKRFLAALLCLVALPCLVSPGFAAINAGERQLIGSTRFSLTQYDYEYRLSVSSTGPSYTGVTATVSSTVPGTLIVAGFLNFPDIPAGGTAGSTNTFIIRQDRTVAFDASKLQITFHAAGIPQADAGADRTAAVNSVAQLDGSGSTDPAGQPLSYGWTLVSQPAGSTAAIVNASSVQPTIVPDRAGDFVAELVVSNAMASSLPARVTISTAQVSPRANAGPDVTVAVPKTVYLDGGGSTNLRGTPLTYAWRLLSRPAGSAAAISDATAVRPTLQADVAGKYVAQLIVRDGSTASAPSVVVISTSNTAPVADAGPGQVVAVPSTVKLNGSNSTDVNGDPLTYSWSFLAKPAGSTAALSSSGAVRPTFVVDTPGLYQLQLAVSDGAATSLATTTVSTQTNLLPVAIPNLAQYVAPNPAQLDGTASLNPNGFPLNYAWSLLSRPAGSAATLTTPSSPVSGFTPGIAGTYVAQLLVTDGQLTGNPRTVALSTANQPPVAQPAAASEQVDPVQLVPTFTWDGSGSFDQANSPLTYSWSLLSRPGGSASILNSPSSAAPTLTADRQGPYVAQLIANNGSQQSLPRTATFDALFNTRPVAGEISVSSPWGSDCIVIDFTTHGTDAETASSDLSIGIQNFPLFAKLFLLDGHTPVTAGSLIPIGPICYKTNNRFFSGSDTLTYTVTDRGYPDNCGTPGSSCLAPAKSKLALVKILVTEQ
ncbi:MAG: Ig family protein [Candidatus Solibacter sp.]|nr:Ig family protein [Candidatus Solibacter sp.]